MRLTFLAAALCALSATVAVPAQAATGKLTVDGKTHTDPKGCYAAARWPMSVVNDTDQTVFVFGGENCSGGFLAAVPPGQSTVQEFGRSVYVP